MTSVPAGDLNRVPKAAKASEAGGFHRIAVPENRHDPFLPLGVAAISTEHIELGTSVAIAFPRSPMVVANTAWDLQLSSRGRFVLGLGPQIRPHNERRFSVPWSAPAPRLREYVNALRAIWRCWQLGEKLDFRGEHYNFTLMIPNFSPEPVDVPSVPVSLAAIGPNSLRLSGEVADGVQIHPFCTRSYLEKVCVPLIEEGMAKTGRKRENFEIQGGGFVATGPDDEAVAKAVELVRYRVAFYGSTPSYWPTLDHHDLGDLGRKLNKMTKAGQWDDIAAEVSDDVLARFAAIGRHDEIGAEIDARFGGIVDVIGGEPGLPRDLIEDIGRLPCGFSRFVSQW
ncbi:MAG: putative F420-dependent oxidoreductase [Myxococcota bacterium]